MPKNQSPRSQDIENVNLGESFQTPLFCFVWFFFFFVYDLLQQVAAVVRTAANVDCMMRAEQSVTVDKGGEFIFEVWGRW